MYALPPAWTWQPAAPPLQILLAAGVLTALAVLAYARTVRGRPIVGTLLLVLRLGVIAALALLLMGPSRMPPQAEQSIRPRLTVLLDTSESMRTGDCGGQSRFEAARSQWLADEQLAALGRDFEVDLNGFDERLAPLSPGDLRRDEAQVASGRATHLAEAVTQALSRVGGAEGGALLVLSDGHDSTDAPIQPAAALAKSRQVPVYTAAFGGRSSERDLAVLAVPMQEYMLPGEPGGILVKIYQSGYEGQSATIRLRRDGQARSIPVTFEQGGVAEVQLSVEHEEPGQYEYTVEIEPQEGEAESGNNAQTVFCDVQKRRLRVLLLEGQPFWDSKFLAQSLRKDEQIELTQITQLSRQKRETIVTRAEGGTPALPKTVEEWSAYDVVILGRSLENVLAEASAGQLVEYVAGGGHVILARGRPYEASTPQGRPLAAALAPIEPVAWGEGSVRDVSLSVTAAGRSSHWFATAKMGLRIDDAFARLPGFQWMPAIEREKPATIVLARAGPSSRVTNADDGAPAIVTMSTGRGSVAAILGEGSWKWSLLAEDKQDLVGFYDAFWSNLVRWLAMGGDFQPGQQVALKLSRTSTRLGDTLLADVAYKHAPPGGTQPTLELVGPKGERQQIALHPRPGRDPRFQATLETELPGVYSVHVAAPGMLPSELDRKFNVYDVNEERLNTAARPMPLRVLAEHSGGAFFEPHQWNELSDRLRRHRAAMLAPPQLEFIWNHWAVMVVLLVWAGTEWILRRLTGLL